MATFDEMLAEDLAGFYADPLGHVMYSYPWDTERSIQVVPLPAPFKKRFPNCEWGPDLWACEFLDQLGEEIADRKFNGRDAVRPIRFATVSGHGIGKTTIVAWLIKFLMDTRVNAVGTVTAVTDDQLRTKTWAELSRWHHMSMTEHLFDISTSRGNMALWRKDPKFQEKWRCTARTCRAEKSEAFAGQHAPTSSSFYIFDEASGIDDKIYEVREGGLSDGEPMVFDFGNGTRNSGQFYENCEGENADDYIVRSIDSRSVKITNKEKIAEDMNSWRGGEDGDRFRTRWRGMFPKSGSMQFIGGDTMMEAGKRDIADTSEYPRILGVDVAREGDDDTVIWPRKGLDARSFEPMVAQGLKTGQCVKFIVDAFEYFKMLGDRPQMIFIDQGGNPGVFDRLVELGYPAVGINFGNSAFDKENYRYRVDEMWGKLREALENGLCVPPRTKSSSGQRLYNDLTQREYGHTTAGQIRLETKREMKRRGLPSPDYADALCLTYAQDVAMIGGSIEDLRKRLYDQAQQTYDPHEYLEAADAA